MSVQLADASQLLTIKQEVKCAVNFAQDNIHHVLRFADASLDLFDFGGGVQGPRLGLAPPFSRLQGNTSGPIIKTNIFSGRQNYGAYGVSTQLPRSDYSLASLTPFYSTGYWVPPPAFKDSLGDTQHGCPKLNAVSRLRYNCSRPTRGEFRLGTNYNGSVIKNTFLPTAPTTLSDPIQFDASADDVATALATIFGATISVTGGPLNKTHIDIEFLGNIDPTSTMSLYINGVLYNNVPHPLIGNYIDPTLKSYIGTNLQDIKLVISTIDATTSEQDPDVLAAMDLVDDIKLQIIGFEESIELAQDAGELATLEDALALAEDALLVAEADLEALTPLPDVAIKTGSYPIVNKVQNRCFTIYDDGTTFNSLQFRSIQDTTTVATNAFQVVTQITNGLGAIVSKVVGPAPSEEDFRFARAVVGVKTTNLGLPYSVWVLNLTYSNYLTKTFDHIMPRFVSSLLSWLVALNDTHHWGYDVEFSKVDGLLKATVIDFEDWSSDQFQISGQPCNIYGLIEQAELFIEKVCKEQFGVSYKNCPVWAKQNVTLNNGYTYPSGTSIPLGVYTFDGSWDWPVQTKYVNEYIPERDYIHDEVPGRDNIIELGYKGKYAADDLCALLPNNVLSSPQQNPSPNTTTNDLTNQPLTYPLYHLNRVDTYVFADFLYSKEFSTPSDVVYMVRPVTTNLSSALLYWTGDYVTIAGVSWPRFISRTATLTVNGKVSAIQYSAYLTKLYDNGITCTDVKIGISANCYVYAFTQIPNNPIPPEWRDRLFQGQTINVPYGATDLIPTTFPPGTVQFTLATFYQYGDKAPARQDVADSYTRSRLLDKNDPNSKRYIKIKGTYDAVTSQSTVPTSLSSYSVAFSGLPPGDIFFQQSNATTNAYISGVISDNRNSANFSIKSLLNNVDPNGVNTNPNVNTANNSNNFASQILRLYSSALKLVIASETRTYDAWCIDTKGKTLRQYLGFGTKDFDLNVWLQSPTVNNLSMPTAWPTGGTPAGGGGSPTYPTNIDNPQPNSQPQNQSGVTTDYTNPIVFAYPDGTPLLVFNRKDINWKGHFKMKFGFVNGSLRYTKTNGYDNTAMNTQMTDAMIADDSNVIFNIPVVGGQFTQPPIVSSATPWLSHYINQQVQAKCAAVGDLSPNGKSIFYLYTELLIDDIGYQKVTDFFTAGKMDLWGPAPGATYYSDFKNYPVSRQQMVTGQVGDNQDVSDPPGDASQIPKMLFGPLVLSLTNPFYTCDGSNKGS